MRVETYFIRGVVCLEGNEGPSDKTERRAAIWGRKHSLASHTGRSPRYLVPRASLCRQDGKASYDLGAQTFDCFGCWAESKSTITCASCMVAQACAGLPQAYAMLRRLVLCCGVNPADEIVTAGHTYSSKVSSVYWLVAFVFREALDDEYLACCPILRNGTLV